VRVARTKTKTINFKFFSIEMNRVEKEEEKSEKYISHQNIKIGIAFFFSSTQKNMLKQ